MDLLFRYLGQHKRVLFGALALATVNQVFSLLDPQIFRMMIDNYGSRAGQMPTGEFLRGVALLALGLVGVAFVSRLAKNFQDYYVSVMMQRVGARLYSDAVGHAFSLPYGAFEDERSGALLQKLQRARTDSQALISSAISIVFLSLIGMLFVITYAFTVHWMIGATYLTLIPVLGVITFSIGRRVKVAQTNIVRESAELAGSTTETLRNVELVKSLGLEDQEARRLNNVNDRILGLELVKVKTIRVLSFIQGTAIQAIRTALLILMFWLIATGEVTLGQFFTLLFYSFMIFNPLTELGQVSQNYQEARASLEQVAKVMAARPEMKPTHPKAVGTLADIKFQDVGFRYAEDLPFAVRKLSFAVKSGETIAFVGPSGTGKSTLLKLFVGLYKPTEGEISVNGVSASELDYVVFRQRIGYVSQDTQLFAGTIRENLLFVRPEATDEECLAALRGAAAMPIIERSGKGLDTKIGEGGIKISGGERQRLAIARALLREPDLIIFDEATSSLDSLTERAITETIQNIAKARPNIMTVLVAHRLGTVAHADRIFVLERGSISEVGRHDKLLKSGGLYAALWREQSAVA